MRVSWARRVASVGLVVATAGGFAATSAFADDPTSGAGLRVQKVDEDGKPLAGARYEATFCFYDIYSPPADRTWNCTTNDHWVSNAQGYLVLDDPSDVNDGIPFEQYPLVYGCPYCGDASEITTLVGVKEVEAPAGYELDDSDSTYYPGYLDDGSDKWGTATSKPGVETGAPTRVSQTQLGDAGTLHHVDGQDFSGYEAIYTNKFVRSGLDARATDSVTGAGVAGSEYVVTLCDGDPENCRTLPQTFTSGADGVLRDANGATLASIVKPKMLENARVTITQTKAADGYESTEPVVATHAAGTTGWIVGDATEPKNSIDLPMVKKPVAPTTDPTTPTTDPTTPTTDPTTPTTDPTTPTTDPTTPTTDPTTPTTDPTTPTTDPTTPTTDPTTPTTDPTTPTTSHPGTVHPTSQEPTPRPSGTGPKVDTDRVTPGGRDLGIGLSLFAALVGGGSVVAHRARRGGAYRRR